MLLWLLSALVAVICVWAGVSVWSKKSEENAITGRGLNLFREAPGWRPIIGHFLVFALAKKEHKNNRLMLLDQFITEHGGKEMTVQVHVPGRSYTFTANPDIVQYITSTNHEKTFKKGDAVLKQYEDFFGQGIFNVNGQEWRDLRSSASRLFQVSSLRQFVSVFHDNANRLFDKMEAIRATPEYQKSGVDMQDMFMRYTLDSFTQIGFGVDLRSIEQDENHFAKAFDKVQTFSERRGEWGTWWGVKEAIVPDREFRESLELMNETVYSIIRQRESEAVEDLEAYTDILSRLLQDTVSKKSETRDKFLRDFVMNFLIAGRDTTAMLLTWCFYLLAKHPDVEKKCIEEIEEVIGDDEVNWDNIKQCKYIKWVLQETLRMYPPVPVDGYTCTEDDILPGNFYCRKGSEVYYVAPTLHRRSDLFPDPDVFKPERWADPVAHPYAYVPFHTGPRQCLGKEMAFEEGKVMVINLLRRYHLKLHDGFEPEVKAAIILTAGNGMRMDLIDRK